MCGILGIVGPRQSTDDERAVRSLDLMRHRGPDRTSQWCDSSTWLGHNRLSIVDLSNDADQPMSDKDGRFRVVFNGEIYNYQTLRSELQRASSQQWTSASDTEVLLNAYKAWGIESFRRLNGMWAAAILDTADGSVILTRDRFGVKPCYWAHLDGKAIFASEIKSILAMGVATRPDWGQIGRYLKGWGCDSGYSTPFEGIQAVPPGHWIKIDMTGTVSNPRPYWSLAEELVEPPRSSDQRVEHFRELFEDSVRLRLRTDVDTGVALSGGLDSASVYGAAQLLMDRGDVLTATTGEQANFRLFSVANSGSSIDESRWINDCLDYWDDKKSVSWISPEPSNFVDLIDEVVWHQEAPVWSSGVFAFHILYRRIAESGTRVVLEGHGSDEMLGGYPHLALAAVQSHSRLFHLRELWHTSKAFQETVNPGLGQVRSSAMWTFFSNYPATATFTGLLRRLAGRPRRTVVSAGHPYLSHDLMDEVATLESSPTTLNSSKLSQSLELAFTDQILPIVLRVADRASSAYSVESRAPFMDYRLVQYIFSLPASDIVDRQTKQILRRAASSWAPQSVVNRTAKVGFAIDSPGWFRADVVREYLNDTFRSASALNSDVIDSEALIKDLAKTSSMEMDWQRSTRVWEALNIHLWQQKFFHSIQ